MFDSPCPDCRTTVSFPEKSGEATCPECGLNLYVTADGHTGRYPYREWQPGGIQGRRR
jgi:uncharacterized Zn finger protein (UPF0148 family)